MTRPQVKPRESEKDFAQAVVDLAQLLGWAVYRTYDSRRSPAGFPDLVLCRPPHLVFAELKTDTGRLRPEQSSWLIDLRACGQVAKVWRPADWDDIEHTLSGSV